MTTVENPTIGVAGTAAMPRAPRRRRRRTWFVGAALLALMAVLLVVYGFSVARDRTEVLMVAEPIAAGEPIEASALTTTLVGVDSGTGNLYPAGTDLSGVVATTDLSPGDLVGRAMVKAEATIPEDWLEVGAIVSAGNYPSTTVRGDELVALSTGEDATTVGVLLASLTVASDESASMVLAAPPDQAATVARWAAGNDLILVKSS